MKFPRDIKNAEIEVKVTYQPSRPAGKPVLEVHKVIKKLNFEK